jgi:hypothetical protein
MVDFTKLAAAAAAAGLDQSVAKQGGTDFTPPAAGPCRLRLVGYIELGKHKGEYQGKPKINTKCEVIFEVSGPKHPPMIMEDGTKVPHLITIKENISQSDKARFFKLFKLLNYAGDTQHMVGLLGRAYKGTIIHRTYKDATGAERVAPELYDKATGAWKIEPPKYEIVDPDSGPTGEMADLRVDPPITPITAFVWELADMEQWAGIFIDGEYPERKNDKGVVTMAAKSKNRWQNTIKTAINFQGSPIYNLLAAGGEAIDIPDAEHPGDEDDEPPFEPDTKVSKTTPKVPTGSAAGDALNGIA